MACMLAVLALCSGVAATRGLSVASISRKFGDSTSSGSSSIPGTGVANTQPTKPTGPTTTSISSIAECTSYSNGFSELENSKAIAKVSASATAYICGNSTDPVEQIANATAKAYAIAVAFAAAECEATGTAQFAAGAFAKAEAKGHVWLSAYAEAFANATECEHCTTFAESWGRISADVFLNATAEANVILEGSVSGGGTVAKEASEFQIHVEGAVATAFAEALARAKSHYGEAECVAWADSSGCVENSCFECQATSVGSSSIKEINAISEASASAAALACGDEAASFAGAEPSAKNIAYATARALSYVYASCESDDGAYSCANTTAYMVETAKAVGSAFAESWAEAIVCKDQCSVEVNTTADSIGSVLATSVTDAYGNVCADSGESWTVSSLQHHIEEGSITALAKAVALSLSSTEKGCKAQVSADTYVGP